MISVTRDNPPYDHITQYSSNAQLSHLQTLSGSGYLANIHFRRVKKLQPNYSNIDNLLKYLDQYEMRQASQYQSESLEVRMASPQLIDFVAESAFLYKMLNKYLLIAIRLL